MNDEFGSFSYGDDTGSDGKRGYTAPVQQPVQTPPMGHTHQPVQTPPMGHTHQPVQTPPMGHTQQPVQTPLMGQTHQPVQTPTMGQTQQPVQTAAKRWTPEPYKEKIYSAPNYVRTDYSRQDYLKPSESRMQAQDSHTEEHPKKNTPAGPSTPKKPKKSGDSMGKKMLKTAAFGLVFGLVGGATFLGINKAFGTSGKTETTETASQSSTATPGTTESSTGGVQQQQVVNTNGSSSTVNYDVAEIVKKAQPSIVSITTSVKTQYQYFYQQFEQESTGAGSGIIIAMSDDKTKLYVATNYHVINGATEINVGFNDGQIIKATVTGYDKNNDVAVVEIPMENIPQSTQDAISLAAIGDSDALQVGEPAIAIGNAMGYGQSVTVGYISALDRSISGGEGKYIQTDAAINPGNSGGALINSKGEVIGINSVKYVDNKVEGMGFSIPINRAIGILENIIHGESTGKVYIGISGATIDSDYSQIYGFPEGAYVKTVTSGSPAEQAGIHEGDIIVAVEGKNTLTMEKFIEVLQDYKAGTQVEITLYRANSRGQYEKMTVSVTTAEE